VSLFLRALYHVAFDFVVRQLIDPCRRPVILSVRWLAMELFKRARDRSSEWLLLQGGLRPKAGRLTARFLTTTRRS
jgi:hypothetical protein